jgi:hypothetical protein
MVTVTGGKTKKRVVLTSTQPQQNDVSDSDYMLGGEGGVGGSPLLLPVPSFNASLNSDFDSDSDSVQLTTPTVT